MTYKNIQDRVLSRLNLSSTTARTRVKEFINERLRRLHTSISLTKTRHGSVTLTAASGIGILTTTGVVKVVTISIPAQRRVLLESTLPQLRAMDPTGTETGIPRYFAVTRINALTVLLKFYPIPDADYILTIDGVLTGADLSADADVPGFTEDFHDALVFGALADEYAHMGKDAESARFDKQFERRMGELRYFMAKAAWKRSLYGEEWYTGDGGVYMGGGTSGDSEPGPANTVTYMNVAASTTDGTTLSAANAERRGLLVYNDSTASLFLNLGSGASSTNFTIKLNPDDYYELPKPIYTGLVTGVWTSAVGFARLTELT